MSQQTLFDYLKKDIDRGVIDHSLRAEYVADGVIKFYIHPENVGGETPTFFVKGNQIASHVQALIPVNDTI
jgi:hypothetical protein